MKKKLAFLRTMKFGMILLMIILVLCFAGSMIVQGRQESEYVARYGQGASDFILALGLDHVFSTPYFIIVGAALCLNLLDCSATRLKATLSLSRSFEQRGENAPLSTTAGADQLKKLEDYLRKNRYRRSEKKEKTLYFKNKFGFWGSFVTHLALLLILIVGTVVLYGAKVQDLTINPGESAVLEDGTEIRVSSFRMTDSKGSLDYASEIEVTLPGGSSSGVHEIKVNEPLRFGSYKVYQQSYRTCGQIELINEDTGEASTVYLDETCFLTLDGETGFYFEGMYPGYSEAEDGGILLKTPSSSSDYSDPVYVGYTVTENGMAQALLFPGDEISAGGVTFRIGDALTSPGLRIKQISGAVLTMLYIVFALMVIGLWMCFFGVPVCVTVGKGGFAVTSSKPQTGLLLELESEGIAENIKI